VLSNNRVDPLLSILRQDDAIARFEKSCLKHSAYLGFVVDQKKRRVATRKLSLAATWMNSGLCVDLNHKLFDNSWNTCRSLRSR